MSWRDITTPIRDGMDVYPGDPPVRVRAVRTFAAGDPYRVSSLAFGSHTATHIDAPAHALPDGPGVEWAALEVLIGPAQLIAVAHERPLDAAALAGAGIVADCRRLLVRTDAAGAPAPAVTPSGARWLVERGVRLVGIDTPSIAGGDDPMPTHRVLLEAGVIIVEGLRLVGCAPGAHEVVCLPLLLPGADGAPARAAIRPLTERR